MRKAPPSDLPRLPYAELYRGHVRDLADELDAAGLHAAAVRLRDAQDTFWTTSSEWLGETALALRAILGEPGVPPELARKLSAVLQELRKTPPPGFRV